MKRLLLILGFGSLLFSTSVFAQTTEINKLAKEISQAYTAKNWDKIDAQKVINGKVKFVIENSLAMDDPFERGSFTSFRQAEKWLHKRESEGFPKRQLKRFVSCRNGHCTYDFNYGISHNQLYLQEILYDSRKGRLYIKSIRLLDGN